MFVPLTPAEPLAAPAGPGETTARPARRLTHGWNERRQATPAAEPEPRAKLTAARLNPILLPS